jgi:cell division protein FtsZ
MTERLVLLPAPTNDVAAPRPTVASSPLPGGAPAISIRVVGIGGAGGNVIDRMAGQQIASVETLAVNTDRQALRGGRATRQICLGETLTRGLGAGGDPVVGAQAAEASLEALFSALRGADLVFIAAGMGGGTGTGAAPVVAEVARQLGALTVALVTRPFAFEGRRRAGIAEQGLAQLRAVADTVIVVPNDRLLQAAARDTTVTEAFAMADAVLRHGVQSIADMVTCHGLINVDFADIRAIMGEAGPAMLGIGVGRGPDRVVEAARRAMACPLLEGRLEGTRRLLLNVSGGEDLGLLEVQRAAELVGRTVDAEANIIFGAVIDPSLTGGQVRVTLVATDFSVTTPNLPRRLYTEVRPDQAEQSRCGTGPGAGHTTPPSALSPGLTPAPGGDNLDLPPFLMRFRAKP